MTGKKTLTGAGVAAVFGRQIAGSPPSLQASELASRQTDMPAKQQDGVGREKQSSVKATYYIDQTLIKPLKFLSVERDADLSTMVNEAIRDLLEKHTKNAGR